MGKLTVACLGVFLSSFSFRLSSKVEGAKSLKVNSDTARRATVHHYFSVLGFKNTSSCQDLVEASNLLVWALWEM